MTPADSPLRVALYAMGGGHGHGMRALAVARALQEIRNRPVHCLLLLPARLRAWAQQARVPSASPPPQAHADPEVLGAWVRESLEAFRPHVLVVDVFPRGVLGELAPTLAPLAPRRLLVTRWVNPRYYLRPDIASFIVESYHGIAWTEPPHPQLQAAFGTLAGGRTTAPILFVRPTEVRSGTTARQYFGIHEREPAVVALGSGDAHSDQALLERMLKLAQGRHRFRLIFFSDHLAAQESRGVQVTHLFPAGAWLRAGRVVVGGAGYQSYYEIVQSGIPAVFCPQDRLLDDQLRRARGEMGTPRPSRARVALHPHHLDAALDELLAWEEQDVQSGRGNLAATLQAHENAQGDLCGAAEVARWILDLGCS